MRGAALLVLALGLLALPLPSGGQPVPDVPNLAKVDRHIAKEPVYQSKQPLYGLYVFGPQAKTRVWAVLDKSKPDAKHYDVLYFDRNADGDLTARDERVVGKVGITLSGEVEGVIVTFPIGTFTDPLTKQKHTGLAITYRTSGQKGVLLQMNWCGDVDIQGGFAPQPGPYTLFAATPAAAPVLWPAADGPLTFQFWMVDPLPVGAATDVRVFLGHQGH